ncbi:methyltransferase domain-containing protein [Streptomyces klenkii]
MKVLEIGAGAGCNASLITAITGAEVVTIDVTEAIVTEAARAADRAGEKNVTALTADGYFGHLVKGPYDQIVVTCWRHRHLPALARPARRRRAHRRPRRARRLPPHPVRHPRWRPPARPRGDVERLHVSGRSPIRVAGRADPGPDRTVGASAADHGGEHRPRPGR